MSVTNKLISIYVLAMFLLLGFLLLMVGGVSWADEKQTLTPVQAIDYLDGILSQVATIRPIGSDRDTGLTRLDQMHIQEAINTLRASVAKPAESEAAPEKK